MKPLSDQLREDYPAVDVTTVVFSRDFAGVSCCVIPQDKVLDVISEIDRLRTENEAMRKALEDARTNICGFNIHNSEQYPETLALFNSEVQRMDKIIRDALAKVTYER